MNDEIVTETGRRTIGRTDDIGLTLFDADAYGIVECDPSEAGGEGDVKLVRSKARVQKHGEVFTPPHIVDMMLSHPPVAELWGGER